MGKYKVIADNRLIDKFNTEQEANALRNTLLSIATLSGLLKQSTCDSIQVVYDKEE